MVVFDGSGEWYWFPIAVALLVGPPLVFVAVGSEIVLRIRRPGQPPWSQRRLMWAVVAAGWMLLALVSQTALRPLLGGHEARATGRTFTFIPYEPRSLPAPFTLESVRLSDKVRQPTLVSQYTLGSGLATAYQEEPVGRLLAEDGQCALTQLGGDGGGGRPPEFPCRELRTPAAGTRVFFDASPGQVPRRMAFAVLNGTLVRLTYEPLPETAVLAYFDSLRPVDRDELEFKDG